MTSPALRLDYTFADYVRFERQARDKHEFVGGVILAMAGGTLEHGARAASVSALLWSQLRDRRCRVFDSNARVRVLPSGNAFYPDVSVVCGKLETDAEDGLSMLNPTVLVEVLSPSTAEYDRTDKLGEYQSIASLQHIVHVSHDERRVEVWTRQGSAWSHASHEAGTTVRLDGIDCELEVDAVFRDPLA